MAPLVSIVIAAWKPDSEHFRIALTSALAQTWPDIEVIVGDDSPTDEVHRWVDAIGDARVLYRRHSPPLGVARNHWEGFGRARGEFIAILNHDDWIAPDFVSRLMAGLTAEPAAVLAFCDHWIISAQGRRLDEATDRNTLRWQRHGLASGLHRPAHDLVMCQALPVAMGTVFRRRALPSRFPADAGPAYDLWLAHLLCRDGAGAWYEPERLSAWRTHSANLTSVAGADWLQGAAQCWQAIASDAAYGRRRVDARRHAAAAFRAASLAALSQGDALRARRLAGASLAMGPNVKGFASALLTALPMPVGQRILRAVR